MRRDTALAASSLLPGPSREALRAAPLSSSSLLGGQCEKASKEDVAARQRVLLNRQTGPVASSVKKLSKPRARGQGALGGGLGVGWPHPSPIGKRFRTRSQSFALRYPPHRLIRLAAEGLVGGQGKGI